MKTIRASYKILNKETINGAEILREIEVIGRTCYKSEKMINNESAEKFVATLIKNGHEAMIEHNSITVKFICDRGISHELVRHRLASFGQESTRYCNYSKDKFGKEITFIEPCFFDDDIPKMITWLEAMHVGEKHYFQLIDSGATPEEARSVLPHSLKTEVNMTMNLRAWRHFFKLRCASSAHPQMRELTLPLLGEMIDLIPVVFDDLINLLIDSSLQGSIEIYPKFMIKKSSDEQFASGLIKGIKDGIDMGDGNNLTIGDVLAKSLQRIRLIRDDSLDRSITGLPHIPSFLRDKEVK